MKNVILSLTTIFTVALGWSQSGKELVAASVKATGGIESFHSLKNVNYDMEYKTPPGEKATHLIANETYVFDGEKSHANYTTHSITGANGKVVEGYDGTNAWVTFDGVLSKEPQPNGVARFLRKTNFYWFSMFFKLLDDGLSYEKLEDQTINEINYQKVKVTFGENIGDASDIYVLYINPKTQLIDQFLFTVKAFEINDPLLMTYEWETINEIKVPSKRKYIEADWDANIIGKEYTTTTWTNIKFNTDIDPSIFNRPNN